MSEEEPKMMNITEVRAPSLSMSRFVVIFHFIVIARDLRFKVAWEVENLHYWPFNKNSKQLVTDP